MIEPGDYVKAKAVPFYGFVVREGTLKMGRQSVPCYVVETRRGKDGKWVEDVIFKEDTELLHKGPFDQ